jgi:CubicO group peptidase (beta-lactamase class C family)
LREKISNGPETKFLIGSISKQFTAVMILKLVEMGRLSLDSTLAEALPYYRKDTGTKVKIRQLLEHTSGIPSFTDFLQEGVHVFPSIREFILKYCSRELDVEPGARFLYNNGGYVILGAVVEQLTGLSYKDALAQHVLSPLGMNSSGLARQGIGLPQAPRATNDAQGKSSTPAPSTLFWRFRPAACIPPRPTSRSGKGYSIAIRSYPPGGVSFCPSLRPMPISADSASAAGPSGRTERNGILFIMGAGSKGSTVCSCAYLKTMSSLFSITTRILPVWKRWPQDFWISYTDAAPGCLAGH